MLCEGVSFSVVVGKIYVCVYNADIFQPIFTVYLRYRNTANSTCLSHFSHVSCPTIFGAILLNIIFFSY